MESENIEQKVPFYKKKILTIPALAIFTIALVAAAVLYATIPATTTVSEAFSTTTVAVDYSGFPGETVCEDIDVDNAANVALNTLVTYTETANVNSVDYTNNMPITQSLAPGANIITTCLTYADDTVLGDVTGTVTLERVA